MASMHPCDGTTLSESLTAFSIMQLTFNCFQNNSWNYRLTKSLRSNFRWARIWASILLMPILIGTILSKKIQISALCDHRWHVFKSGYWDDRNLHVNLRSVGKCKTFFTWEFAKERHFRNVFCFSACSDQVLITFQYGFRARSSLHVNFSGIWSCKTILFDANNGTTF